MKRLFLPLLIVILAHATSIARADYIWIEGEQPTRAVVTRHPWWYDKVQKNLLSGGDYISNWDPNRAGELIYTFDSPTGGDYAFWVRANPVQASLQYRLNGSPWSPIDLTSNLVDNVNIAENSVVDMRFIAWVKVGTVSLKRGSNTVMFRMDSQNNHCGAIDCFVFTTTPFTPHGILKPDQVPQTVDNDAGWVPFAPPVNLFRPSPIDLRFLNEKTAGDGGFIGVKDGEFVHTRTGEAVRFWGVNIPQADLNDVPTLRSLARLLAKHGVNLIRIHAPYFDESGEVDPKRVQHAIDLVSAMKAEGIYCHFSIYYYAWFHPKPNTPWLDGYDGSKSPVAAIFFNSKFQEQYRKWWKGLLLTPDIHSGKRLIDDPAVASVECLNEDSLLFWTFGRDNIPPAEWDLIEAQFTQWVIHKYGSIDAALTAWGRVTDPHDAPALGRVALRPMWQLIKEHTRRDQDTVAFLAETERNFYTDTERFLHGLGFKGLITTSNWITADPSLEPLEKSVYTLGDFTDRHGYIAPDASGDNADWSIRNGQTYIDRSALRFDPHEPGQPRPLTSPVMDPHLDGKPSMLSEVAISAPDRFRSEAPIYFASYGSLQGSNAIEYFALDSHTWSVKPNYFMQPWPVMSPTTMGQFPAAAVIYRQRLIDPGEYAATINLSREALNRFDLLPTKGLLNGLNEDQPLANGLVDPLACFVGRTAITFGSNTAVQSSDASIDRANGLITSSNKQLQLDYHAGLLRLNAPRVQGISGNLAAAKEFKTNDISINSPLDLGHIVVISLDGKPLATSAHMLLQVMSEERPSDFQTASLDKGRKQIISIGNDPWLFKPLAGSVDFHRGDANKLHITPLDANGYPLASRNVGNASHLTLLPDVVYYSITQ